MDINKIYDKLNQCLQLEIPVFTDFLDLAQLIAYRNQVKLSFSCFAIEYKGFYDDERRLLGFFPNSYKSYMSEDELLDSFPVQLLKIEPSFNYEFAHRDLLGAILGLGLERKLFGDIVFENQVAYILCHIRGAKILRKELVSVARASVTVSEVSRNITNKLKSKSIEISASVASLRIDGIIKSLGGIRRLDVVKLINNGHVKVNQIVINKIHYQIQEGDILSVRTKGKYKLSKIGSKTQKGRFPITILKYI